MPESRQAVCPSELTAAATGWFARLVDAIDRGRFDDAGVAQRELSRLGFLVTLKTPRPFRRRPEGGGR